MERRIFGILFTLVLVLSFSLIAAMPAMAADTRVPPSRFDLGMLGLLIGVLVFLCIRTRVD